MVVTFFRTSEEKWTDSTSRLGLVLLFFCLFVCLNIYESSNFLHFQGSVIQNLAVVNVSCQCQFLRSWSPKDLAPIWIGLVR